MIDPEKINKAAIYTFNQMKPRIITLANAIIMMNKELFPDDRTAQRAANTAAMGMSVSMLVFGMMSKDRELALDPGLRELIHKEVEAAFDFVNNQSPKQPEPELRG